MSAQEKNSSGQTLLFYNPDDQIADSLFSTNNVLIQKIPPNSKEPKQVIVYLPGYMRAKVKNINEIELTNLTSSMNVDLIYDIYFGDLFQSDDRFKEKSFKYHKDGEKMTYEEQLRELFENDFKLNFSRGDPLLLAQLVNEEQNLQIKVKAQKDNQIGFTVRKVLSMHMDANIWLSPFELLNSILQITVHPLTFNLLKTKYTFRMNLMNHPDNEIKLSFPQNKIEYGKYQLAKNLAKTSYTNEKMQKAKQFDMNYEEHQAELDKKHAKKAGKSLEEYRAQAHVQKDINYFQYAYFKLPIYKHPFDSIVTGIVPIWLLGIINLGIFYQDENLNDRLGSIIALVVALITYIPTIEETIPPTPNLVMAKIMVYLEISAVICTFIHSMRVKFETKFRLQYTKTPEYWISFLLLILSAAIIVILTIVHYAYWKRVYNDPRYSVSGIKNEKQQKKAKVKRVLYEFQTKTQDGSPLLEPINVIRVKGRKGMKFKRQQWSNLESDVYFNRLFVGERQQSKKQKNSKKEKKYSEYFVIKQRKFAFTTQQLRRYYVQKLRGLQTEASQTSVSINKNQSVLQHSDQSNQKTNCPLVHFGYYDHSKPQDPSNIKQLNLYLPGYLRLKFKNLNSLDFENLGGDLNATMIFTIYYGQVFEYMKKQLGLNPQDQEIIIKKMKNDFLLTFEKDDALQLTEGKMENGVKVQYNDQDIKPVRNIDLAIKEDSGKKCLQFTIRRVFQFHLDSYVFLTPIQKLKTSIDLNINSIKIPLKTRKLNTTLIISVNLMDRKHKQDKISISQVKKFCRYGLILPQLNIGYYGEKSEADKELKMLWDKDSFWGKRELKKRQEKHYQRIYDDVHKVFTKKEFTAMRNSYREMAKRDDKLKLYFDIRQYSLNQTEQQQKFLLIHKHQSQRKFSEKSSYQPYKYACILIPLYKFPFESIAIIFFPLWLLAILNLGIFFQTQNFGERVISIATLLIAFVSLIPTIRGRIPPNPSITLVEYLVSALMFTCVLTLAQSMAVRFNKGFQFTDWQQDGWFMSSLLITLLTGAIVVVLLIYHYTMLEPNYNAKLKKQNKFNRKIWSNQKCQDYTLRRYSFQIAYQDPQNSQNVVYQIFNQKGSKAFFKSEKDLRTDPIIESMDYKKNEQGFFDRLWKYSFGGRDGENIDSYSRREKGANSQGTLRELKDGDV